MPQPFIPSPDDAMRMAAEQMETRIASAGERLTAAARNRRTPGLRVHCARTDRLLFGRWRWWVLDERTYRRRAEGHASTERRGYRLAKAEMQRLKDRDAAVRAGITNRQGEL